MYINGQRSSSSSSTFEQDLLNQMNTPSPLTIQLVEEGVGSRKVTVTVTSEAIIEPANHKIFVALVEAHVDFDANNGEKEHFDVLRDYLTAPTGDDFSPPLNGEQITLEYQVNIPGGVSPLEAYILVYIQNADTKEILNSATMNDRTSTSVTEKALEIGFQAYPNPVESLLHISVDQAHQIDAYEIYNSLGQLVLTAAIDDRTSSAEIHTAVLVPGSYLLKVLADGHTLSKNFLKK